jgi:tRNA A37 threonylcarbamoyladenosine dehydratase
MPDWLSRTELLLGKDGLDRLKNSNVLIVGLGGVGGYAAEVICRAGVGKMTIVDGDLVQPSNRNRQLLALKSTGGKAKAIVMAERLKDINP